MSRYARKVDSNHTEIVSALRAAGAWVWSTAPLGNGFPDLLVWFRNSYHLLEVKDGRQPRSKRRLTEGEALFHAYHPCEIHYVICAEDALAAIGATAPRRLAAP